MPLCNLLIERPLYVCLSTLVTSAYLLPPRLVDRTSALHLVELVPRVRTAVGQRSFAVNGPTTWKGLGLGSALVPPALRTSELWQNAFTTCTKDAPVNYSLTPLRRLYATPNSNALTDWLIYLLTYLLTYWASRLMELAVDWTNHTADVGPTSLIGFNQLKDCKGDELGHGCLRVNRLQRRHRGTSDSPCDIRHS